MAKQLVIEMDTGGAYTLAGFLKTLSTEVKTDRHMGPVLKYAHAVMAEEFDRHMDLLAESDHMRYHHVYEWGTTDNPSPKDRLWTNILVGRGGSRTATWKWKASTKMVPVSAEAAEVGVKEVHVFVWKAPFMEYNTSGVNIEPKRGPFISAFTQDDYHGLRLIKGPVWVNHPGGTEVQGAFTQAFLDWWAGPAGENAFNTYVRMTLEQGLGRSEVEKALTKAMRARTKTFKLSASADARMGEAKGAVAAQEFLAARDRRYIEMAAARAALMGGSESDD